jgi:putative transposase
MDVSDVAKMRALEDENRRLKRIVADQALNIDALKIVASGNF